MHMINYFLINNASRGAQYGIGTYIKQISAIFNNGEKYFLSYIDFFSNEKEYTIKEDEEGIVHYLIPSKPSYIEDYIYCRNAFYFLVQNIKSDDQMIFHFNFFQHDTLAISFKDYYSNSKIILTVHYMDWCFLLNGNREKFNLIIKEKYTFKDQIEENVLSSFYRERRFLRFCDEVIVLSKFTFSVLIKEYKISKGKLHLIYNGLEPLKLFQSDKSTNLKNNSIINIIYVGRLDDIKGVKYVIKTFISILKQEEKVHLYIIGDGNYNEYLSLCNGIWDKVTFTGKISQEILQFFYDKASIGIQPSFHEQCSYTAIEMLKNGIPLVVSDTTGLKEMFDSIPDNIIHIDDKRFSESKFIEELSNRVLFLLKNADVRKYISEQEEEIFIKRYNSSLMFKSMESLMIQTYNKKIKNFISSDFYNEFDNRMFELINNRPSIDIEFYGISGIGCYLWWRVIMLKKIKNRKSENQMLMISEYLIYYVDWVANILDNENNSFSKELHALLYDMNKNEFNKVQVQHILKRLEGYDEVLSFSEIEDIKIIRNTLKIYNTKI